MRGTLLHTWGELGAVCSVLSRFRKWNIAISSLVLVGFANYLVDHASEDWPSEDYCNRSTNRLIERRCGYQNEARVSNDTRTEDSDGSCVKSYAEWSRAVDTCLPIVD